MSFHDSIVGLDENVRILDTSKHEDAAIFNITQALRFAIQAIESDLREIRQRLDRIESRLASR